MSTMYRRYAAVCQHLPADPAMILGLVAAEQIIKELERWAPDKFVTIVTDNAANMVVARNVVLQRFPKMLDVRYVGSSLIVFMIDECVAGKYEASGYIV